MKLNPFSNSTGEMRARSQFFYFSENLVLSDTVKYCQCWHFMLLPNQSYYLTAAKSYVLRRKQDIENEHIRTANEDIISQKVLFKVTQ